MDKNLLKLTNPKFQIEFDGKLYEVRKANLDKVVRYMQKIEDFRGNGKPAAENMVELVTFCVWLILNEVDPSLTEAYIKENLTGDIDAAELLVNLGFLNPKRATVAEVAKAPLPTSDSSSPSSPKELGGVPEK